MYIEMKNYLDCWKFKNSLHTSKGLILVEAGD